MADSPSLDLEGVHVVAAIECSMLPARFALVNASVPLLHYSKWCVLSLLPRMMCKPIARAQANVAQPA